MSLRSNLKSRLKNERYFPIHLGDVVCIVKYLGLEQFDGSRLAIRMENKEGVCEIGHVLINIMPEEDTMLHPLTEEVVEKISKKCSNAAMQH
jgi:hypothetical protein